VNRKDNDESLFCGLKSDVMSQVLCSRSQTERWGSGNEPGRPRKKQSWDECGLSPTKFQNKQLFNV